MTQKNKCIQIRNTIAECSVGYFFRVDHIMRITEQVLLYHLLMIMQRINFTRLQVHTSSTHCYLDFCKLHIYLYMHQVKH